MTVLHRFYCTEHTVYVPLISCQSSNVISLLIWIHHADENSVDPDQLASNEANRSGSTLFSNDGIEITASTYWHSHDDRERSGSVVE